jgi:hypothetical protein
LKMRAPDSILQLNVGVLSRDTLAHSAAVSGWSTLAEPSEFNRLPAWERQ